MKQAMTKAMISNIWCVGRNYSEHAQELGNPIPEEPLIFLKAGSCLNTSSTITLPDWTNTIHYECELALSLNAHGQPQSLALALDLTARDVQNQLKDKRSPWTLAKSFTGACPISPFITFKNLDHFHELEFCLIKNGLTVQKGHPANMIFPVKTLLSYICKHFPVVDGDLVLTGTPSGVGPLEKGDHLQGIIRDASGGELLNTTWVVN